MNLCSDDVNDHMKVCIQCNVNVCSDGVNNVIVGSYIHLMFKYKCSVENVRMCFFHTFCMFV